jgi:5-formyltetrahydrofolate cyclo-ligase
VTVPSDKADLRRRLRAVRAAVDGRAARSVALCAAVVELPAYATAEVVMSFASFRSEVDTSSLHARAWNDGKALLLPRVEAHDLVAVEVTVRDALVTSPLGIDEPAGPAVDRARLAGSLVIVPGLAFTPDGHRLGYGGGYYDRFLASLPPSVVTIGLCFREQVVDDLPLDPHDLPVDHVVTG